MSEIFSSYDVGESFFPDAYASERWCEREKARLFKEKWLMVGREEDARNDGDFFCLDILGESIFIANSDNNIRAFYNVCPHRGMKLREGQGNSASVVCPFHGWAFSNDGEIFSHPGVRDGEEGFDNCLHGLKKIHCEVSGGFVWVNFSKFPAPLRDQIGSLEEGVLTPFDTVGLTCYKKKESFLQANWKLYLEVGMENLHIPFVHRASIGKQALSRVKTSGEWQCLEMKGAETASLPRHLKGELRNIESLDRKVTRFCLVYPNLFIVATVDSVWWAQTWPVSPETCVVKFGFCVPKSSFERDDFEDIIKPYERHWSQVISEDEAIIQRHQKGLKQASSVFYTRYEKEVEKFHGWLKSAFVEPQSI
ncbi:aromatic ring-hydroxylating dioxygenase subunit alpha [Chromohalobacter sp.]|uniref:aromatic ring-hydroxylating oxygenase subunit alpha n=1 Tax=Chromohalobacter sp. TaxID=50740 RepID=UPI001D9437A8|nr:aromatic ring-hydroxylating dioxygenase subunit alpha [Chromohalobacter sp.]NQY47219.1 aromatic ring-hydroxylating dioxygenase subunit alpha [Chromohalobacter sp.]